MTGVCGEAGSRYRSGVEARERMSQTTMPSIRVRPFGGVTRRLAQVLPFFQTLRAVRAEAVFTLDDLLRLAGEPGLAAT